MKIRILQMLLALAVVIAVMVSGCEWGSGSADSQKDRSIEVRLGYFANLTHAQALLGVSSGDYAAAIAPHKLTTRIFNAGPSVIESLFAGEIDICYIGPGPALSGFEKSRGEALRVVAGAAANGVVIVASPSSDIQTLQDLAGKRIATPQLGNTQDIAARHYLTHTLQQDSADNVVPIPNAEQAAMMSRDQIDAAWAPEPWGERLVQEAGAKIIAEEKDLWPSGIFVLTVVVVRTEFLEKHPDVVESFLAAHVKWTGRLNQEGSALVPQLESALFDLTNKHLSPSVLEKAMSRVKFMNDPLPETFQTFAKWSMDLGFSKGSVDLATLTDTRILEKVTAAPAASPVPSGGNGR